MTEARTNLFGLPRQQMEAFFAELGEKPFRARQIMQWLYRQGVDDFSAMTDLSKSLRSRLADIAELHVPEIIVEQRSSDDTRKWMLGMDGAQGIETVFIPETARGTLCISSQVGCVLDCSFCSTAQQGFNRNLSTAEIIGQVWLANRELGYRPDGIGSSPTWCLWAWASRWPTTATWFRRWISSLTISVSGSRAAA